MRSHGAARVDPQQRAEPQRLAASACGAQEDFCAPFSTYQIEPAGKEMRSDANARDLRGLADHRWIDARKACF
jgi:hypothetical protein